MNENYPEENNGKTRVVVIVFEDEMTDEALNRLQYEELAEDSITIYHGFDNNTKVIASVPDQDDVDDLLTYWKEAINELTHPCCNLCRSRVDGSKPGQDCDDCSDDDIPKVYEVRTMSDFIQQDKDNNSGEGLYTSEFEGFEEIM